MTEYIDKHKTVNTSVRMIADRDERSVRQHVQNFGILYFIANAKILEHGTSKRRTGMTAVSVIKIVHLVYRKHVHERAGECIASLTTKQRRHRLQLIYCQ